MLTMIALTLGLPHEDNGRPEAGWAEEPDGSYEALRPPGVMRWWRTGPDSRHPKANEPSPASLGAAGERILDTP